MCRAAGRSFANASAVVARAAGGETITITDRGRAREVLDSLTLLQLRPTLMDHADRIDPVELRSLDAIHLAAALDLGDDLEAILTYDERLAEAAEANGIAVIAPS